MRIVGVGPVALLELFKFFAELLELSFVHLDLINKITESDLLFDIGDLVNGVVLQKSFDEHLLVTILILGLLLVDFQQDVCQQSLVNDLRLTLIPFLGFFYLDRSVFFVLSLVLDGIFI